MAWDDYEPRMRAMTAEDWLGVFEAQVEEGMEEWIGVFGPQRTLVEWMELCVIESMSWEGDRTAYEKQYDARIPHDRWIELTGSWKAQRKTTLGELCDFLAGCGGRMAEVEAVRVLGRPCREAGAFLSLRSLLAAEGADVEQLRPSSALSPWVGRWQSAFVNALWRLCPRVASLLRCRASIPHTLALLLSIGAMLTFIVSAVAESFWGYEWASFGVLVSVPIAVSGVALWWLLRKRRRARVWMEGVETMGDLCRLISAEPLANAARG